MRSAAPDGADSVGVLVAHRLRGRVERLRESFDVARLDEREQACGFLVRQAQEIAVRAHEPVPAPA